ncbi:MAG: Gfo/Idh/MocA family oxidoreductase, partial [Actinobacteria bacterium]|nr:Gfo/Idh/MocA family oxidoreductase [Actinomycetota bacterium]
ATEGCDVVDVVSARDDDAVRQLCRRHDVDLVSVHSPPFLHARHVGFALDAHRAVLCDKPFGLDVREAESMLAAADAARVVHLANFEFRFDPARVQMREWIAGGALGAVEHVGWTHLSAGTRNPLRAYGWLFDRSRGGGWIGAWGSHAVDTLRFLLADEVTGASAALSTTIAERPDRDGVVHVCDAEDGMIAAISMSGGARASIDSGFAASVSLPPRIVVTGERGAIENVADARVVLRGVDGTREECTFGGTGGTGGHDRHAGPMARWAQIVRDAVRAGAPPTDAPTFEDAVACARVLDQLRATPLLRAFGRSPTPGAR